MFPSFQSLSITRPEPTEAPADLVSHTIVIFLISETISAYSAVISLTDRVGDGGTRCGSPQLSPPVKFSRVIKKGITVQPLELMKSADAKLLEHTTAGLFPW